MENFGLFIAKSLVVCVVSYMIIDKIGNKYLEVKRELMDYEIGAKTFK